MKIVFINESLFVYKLLIIRIYYLYIFYEIFNNKNEREDMESYKKTL